jgi:Ca2+/Na+ antiporter
MWYLIDRDEDNLGINAKFIVLTSACLKLGGLIPCYLLLYALCKVGTLNIVYYSSYKTVINAIYAPWAIYAMARFFDGNNHTRHEAGFLYGAMIYLLIEGIIICLSILLVLLILSCVCLLIWYLYRSERQLDQEQVERNQQITNLINNLDVLKLTGHRFEQDEICCICLSNFYTNQDIIRLPCNRNHFFHRKCINDWTLTSPTCPLCKCEINEELLDQISDNAASSQRLHKNSNYGSIRNEEVIQPPAEELENCTHSSPKDNKSEENI